ncbi:hypothetical protein EBR96_03220 [bacterium]|nr:hypothetical protein [bacterium]
MAVFLIELFPVDSAALELPIRYSIGRVDKRFGISESQLREAISLAEEIWETPLKMELFEYDPSAALKINLVYDGRQQFAVQSRLVETDLKKIQNVHSDLVQKYERLTELHRIQQNRYYQTKSEENRRLANALAVQINQLAAQLNKLASTYNSGVASYRQRYGG